MILSAALLKDMHACGDVHLAVAAARVVDDDHQRDSLIVVLRDESGALLGIVSVNLNEMRLGSECSLHRILERVSDLKPLLLHI